MFNKRKEKTKIAPEIEPEKAKRKYSKKNSLQISKNSIVVIDPQLLILKAIEKDLDIDKMEKLLTMRRELCQENEKRLYFENLAKFQGECPVIEKKLKVLNKDQKSTRYVYAPIEDMIEPIKPYFVKYGFSYHFETVINVNKENKSIWVETICITNHEAGHSETTTFKAPVDLDAYMTSPQKIGSASTFSQRYALKNAFGLIMRGEDDDGNSSEDLKPVINKTKQKTSQPKQNKPDSKTNNITNISDYQEVKEEVEEDLKKKCAKIIKDTIAILNSKDKKGVRIFSGEEMIKNKRAIDHFIAEKKQSEALNALDVIECIRDQRTNKNK